MKKSLFSIGLVMLTGCSLMQSSSMVQYGGAKLYLPKDAVIGYFHAETIGTNLSVTITNSTFTMNPAVIDAATTRDIALIRTTADAVGAAIGQAAKTAAK